MRSHWKVAAASFLLALAVLLPSAHSAGPIAKGVDPKAAEVMQRFSDFAASLRSFSVNVESNLKTIGEEPERRNTLSHVVTAQKPDKLRVASTQKKHGNLALTDGKVMTLYVPTLKSYQEKPALPHVEQLLTTAGAGARFLAGIFAAPPSSYYMKEVVKCEYLGQDQAQGRNCDHLKFTSAHPGKDGSFNWEGWFQQGDTPLLLKMVGDFSSQGVAAEFLYKDWQVNPALAAEAFTFTPPAGVERADTLFASLVDKADPRAAATLLGKPAPEFVLPLLGGGEVDLKQHAGKEVVILDFFATWCGVCRASMPTVSEVMQEYKGKGVVLYAIDGDAQEDEATIRAFMKELKINPAVALDEDSVVSDAYGASGLPTMVIIGKEGTVQAVHEGVPRDLSKYAPELRHELDTLLAGKKLTK